MRHAIGIDIGGINTKIGVVREGPPFKVLKQTSIPTQVDDPISVYVKRVAEAVKQLVRESGLKKVNGVGVGCPGLIDPWKGLVRTSPNLPNLRGVRLADKLGKAIGLPVRMQNDANAAALGEYLFGSGRRCPNLIVLTLGTGVGGGVICDGHLVVGADNGATELGHLKAEWHDGAPCGCGKTGCVEAYVGAAGIARIAKAMLDSGAATSLQPDHLTPRDVAMAARSGDAVSLEVMKKVGHYLGRGMALLIDTFNPERIVFTGGTSAAADLLMPGIEEALDQYASFEFTRKRVKISRSKFADDVNVIGAAAVYLNAAS